MKFNKIIRQYKLVALLVFALLLVSAGSVGLNKGLKLSEFNYQIKVEVSGEDSEKAIEALRNSGNVSRVNKRDLEIFYTKLNRDEVEKKVSETFEKESIKSTFTTFEYKSDISQKELASQVGISLGFFTVITTIFSYITVYRFNSRLKLQSIVLHCLQAVSFFLITLALTIGSIAIISNLYLIQKDNILVIYVTAFIAITIYAVGLLNLDKKDVQSLKEISTKLFPTSANFGLNLLKVSALVTLALSFGLGVNFIMTGVLILLGIVYSLSSLIIVFKFDFKELKNFNFGKLKKEKAEVKKEAKKTTKKSPQKPSTSRSKKAKPTKKRKI